MWSKKEAQALRFLFDRLDKAGIHWMVFRNFEGLPEKNPSKDVDLLINRNQIPEARIILEKAMHDCGYHYRTFDEFQCIWCYSFFDEETLSSVKIDLFYGQVWRGSPTVPFEKIYDLSVVYNGMKVPNHTMNAFLLWIKPVMTGGKTKAKYVPEIQKYVESKEFHQLTKETFGMPFYEEVKPYLAKEKIADTGFFQKKMCRTSWKRAFFQEPCNVLASTYMHFWLEIKRRSHRPIGTVVCLLGPDGVGKTTVLEKLKTTATDLFIRDEDKVVVRHFRPNVFPNLKKVVSGESYDPTTERFTEPHRAKQVGKVSSLVRMTYYWLDYIIGWPAMKKECVNGRIILYDRYIYDFYVDPKRSRIKIGDKVRLFFVQCTPHPDIVYVLIADPATIHKRKAELEPEEIARQVREYKHLSSKFGNFQLVNAEQEQDEIVREICQSWVKTLIPN